MVETWRTAHAFTLLPLEGESPRHEPLAVFTAGPVATDVAALKRPTPELVTRLGRGLGLEWVASLVEIDRPSELGEATLTRHLREHFGLRAGYAANPFAVRRGELARRRHTALPAALLADFVADEYGRLEWIGNTINRLAGPLIATAHTGEWDVSWQPERARDLFNALESPLKLHRMSSPANEKPVYGFGFADLYARALLEIVELYDDRPPLAICPGCRRLFVPRRKGQRSCRRYVWLQNRREAIAGCELDRLTTPRRAQIDAQARRREYTQLNMRVRRRTEALGPDNPSTKRAVKEFADWRAANFVPVGRRPNPEPELFPLPYRGDN